MKILRLMLVSFVALGIVACTERKGTSATEEETQVSKVFLTKDISPEGLVKAFQALGVAPQGKVAVKISTGESGGHNYLKPTLIRNLVELVDGTIVECCTAYGGSRQDISKHWSQEGDDAKPLQERINRQHGTYIVDYAEQIGLGSKQYELVSLDEELK